jgi:mannose-6-phosphate isomerase
MNQVPLYPLRFEPIYQYRLWGGRRLADLLSAPLPEGPVGEAWLLCDRDDHSSVISNGLLKGRTLGQLLRERPKAVLGQSAGDVSRFPLLLKFLDVQGALSVQVHPSDAQTSYLPEGESGKTEAWVVLAAGPEGRIYAGLAPNTKIGTIRQALAKGTLADLLASFSPNPGDAILMPAGTVHALRDLLVFEVQENSDVTYRLYDWDHVDAKTHQPRPLQVEMALACIDWTQGAISPVIPVVEGREPALREKLFDCEYFGVWRVSSAAPFTVGAEGTPRVLVCIEGQAQVRHDGVDHFCANGEVMFLPAAVGACVCQPRDSISLLEISLPTATDG